MFIFQYYIIGLKLCTWANIFTKTTMKPPYSGHPL